MTEVSSGQNDLLGAGVSNAARNRLALFEDCAEAIDQMYVQALESAGSAAFRNFLNFMARFSNLSAYNAMLVAVQRRGAIAVGTRRQWASIDRDVNPDAVPIVVLQPFGPVRFVFEYSDTDGRPIPGEKLSSLFAEGSVPEKQYERTRTAASEYAIRVEETDHYGGLLAGTAAAIQQFPEPLAPKSGNAGRFRIRLNAKHDLPTRFATLAHELGHIYCGHLGADGKGRWPNRSKLTQEVRELEAEAVAWLVCQRTGVISRSAEYLSSLATPERIKFVSAYAVFEAANRVEARSASLGRK